MGRDDLSFKSSIPTVNSQQLLADSNFVVTMVSYGCPGHPQFMPALKSNIDLIKEKGYNLYIINDSEYSLRAENKINKLADLYEINEQIFLIEPKDYPNNGGFFDQKKRYLNFINDLSLETKNLSLGYGYYVVFKNGKLTYDGYGLDKNIL